MRLEEKLKNIYDLEYNKIINYFNVFMVILGTFLITFWIVFTSSWKFWLIIYIKLLVSAGIILLGFVGWTFFNNKLEEIKTKIKGLP